MIVEMTAMKSDLYDYASAAYTTHAKELAIAAKLTFPPGQQKIVLDRDLTTALHALERSRETEVLVYKLFHHRIRTDKNWHASIVDKWAEARNMKLIKSKEVYVEGRRKRRNEDSSRLGFGAICLEARKKVLQKYMRPMFKALGWMIATTDKGSRKGVAQKYFRREVADEKTGRMMVFYVVEGAKDVSCATLASQYRVRAHRLCCSIALVSQHCVRAFGAAAAHSSATLVLHSCIISSVRNVRVCATHYP